MLDGEFVPRHSLFKLCLYLRLVNERRKIAAVKTDRTLHIKSPYCVDAASSLATVFFLP
jgi:hypothetical protein